MVNSTLLVDLPEEFAMFYKNTLLESPPSEGRHECLGGFFYNRKGGRGQRAPPSCTLVVYSLSGRLQWFWVSRWVAGASLR